MFACSKSIPTSSPATGRTSPTGARPLLLYRLHAKKVHTHTLKPQNTMSIKDTAVYDAFCRGVMAMTFSRSVGPATCSHTFLQNSLAQTCLRKIVFFYCTPLTAFAKLPQSRLALKNKITHPTLARAGCCSTAVASTRDLQFLACWQQ